MPRLDHNAHTTGRVQSYYDAIVEHLREVGVASAAELEDLIRERFGKDWTEEDRSWVVDRNRRPKVEKWRNDVHWVRAWLTRQRRTVTFEAAGRDWVVPLPDGAGEVLGTSLVKRADARGLLEKLARRIVELRETCQRD